MGIDIQKLSSKEHLDKLDQNSVLEILEDIPESLIQFSANPILNYCLEKKFGLKDKPSPRVLNNWVKNGLVKVDENDKGKVKRFDRLESIWLNIVVELRDFGLPLDSIARTRKILFDYQLKGFSLFKFQVLNCILRKPQTLVVYKNGDARILATEIYSKLLNKHQLSAHININLDEFIIPEFPRNLMSKDFKISNAFSSNEKLKMLYFLKTGDFQEMKVRLSQEDIRYVDKPILFEKSKDLQEILTKWSFEEILVTIDDESETVILSKK